MSPMVPSDKIIYTIGDAARIADVKPYVLRYWETEFDLLRPEKSVTGQRCYRVKDLRLVLTLKRLLHLEGFTIAGARKRLSEMGEDAWDAFPPGGPDAERPLPEGRSLEGTPDAPLIAETFDGTDPAPPSEDLPENVLGWDPAKSEELQTLWDDSQRILNKYLL